MSVRPHGTGCRLGLVTLALLACCAPARTPRNASDAAKADAPPMQDYPGALVPVDLIPRNFLARQEVRARYAEREIRFECVLQKQRDVLTLIGLTPFGTKAFVLEQRGTTTSFTPFIDRKLAFPPSYMLVDIHRALFREVAASPLPDGEHTAVRDDEEILEQWSGECLQERRFRRLSGTPPGDIAIRYVHGMKDGVPPDTIELWNGWFGYSLTITTLSYRGLP